MPTNNVLTRQEDQSTVTTPRLRRFRARHPRIDFYPSADVLAILLHHRRTGTDPTFAGILDGLIRIGHRFVSGNGER